jgi:hypothetical protein
MINQSIELSAPISTRVAEEKKYFPDMRREGIFLEILQAQRIVADGVSVGR